MSAAEAKTKTAVPGTGVIPAVGGMRPPKLPAVAERVLDNGLRVLAVRKPGVPLAEVRLVTPVARANDATDLSRQRMLSETLLSGTSTRTSTAIAEELQRLGGSLASSFDADELVMSGSAIASNMGAFLTLMGDVLTDAAFPDDEVSLHRARIQQEIQILSNQPGLLVEKAYRRRLYGKHPYSAILPEADAVGKVTRAALQKLHDERVLPRGSVLVIVGDMRPERALDEAQKAFGGWVDAGEAERLPEPKPLKMGPAILVDRPGSVQTSIRVGGFAIPRSHPDFPKLAVANTIFGGYFSSRLTANIREDKGYTYSPSSSISQNLSATHITVGADVATEVTAPALLEIRYELARMASAPVTDEELTSAKRYLQGSMAIASQTQAGLASYLMALASFGLGIEYLRDLPAAIEKVTPEQVQEVASTYMAPRKLVTVLLGDADKVATTLSYLDEVERTGG